MSKEDELAVAIMNKSDDTDLQEVTFDLEVPYDHYGTRGVVDMVEVSREGDGSQGNSTIWIYELKSESAVSNSTGANEIIRQFKRHREYFFKGTDYSRDDFYAVNYALVFYATDYTYEHLKQNETLYHTLIQDNPEGIRGAFSHVIFYHPDAEGYAHYFSDFWGAENNSRSILKIIGREDDFIPWEDAVAASKDKKD